MRERSDSWVLFDQNSQSDEEKINQCARYEESSEPDILQSKPVKKSVKSYQHPTNPLILSCMPSLPSPAQTTFFQSPQFMARRSSTTQLAELNAALLAQNQQLAGTARVAQEALGTQNNIQGELYRQRGVIENNIDKNKEIKTELAKASKKTNEMRRRNFCIKLLLWIVLIVLFAANIGLVIWKLT